MPESVITSWFDKAEYKSRLSILQAELKKRSLDGLVTFLPETITWTTGFYTRAFTGFQLAVIPAIGEPTIMCRNVSLFYVERTYAFSQYELWKDGDDKTQKAIELIGAVLGSSSRLGIEAGAWSVSYNLYRSLMDGLPDVKWTDVGDMAAMLRLTKSPAEIAYLRKAAVAAEAGMTAGVEAAQVGNCERDIAAAVCAAMIKAGSDHAGPGVLSSGERANHLHGGATDRVLEVGDTMQLEPTPHVHHYNARFMRTIKVSEASDEDFETAAKLIDIQDKALATVAPGVAATVPDKHYREGILDSGLADTYTNKTFYSVGMLMDPTDAEPLEANPVATWSFEAGMTFHSYLLVKDFGFSETILITEDGYERLTKYPRKLIISGRGLNDHI